MVSVRPVPPGDGPDVLRGGPGTSDPELITYERVSLLRVLSLAYSLDWSQIAGPPWIASTYYSIVARVPPSTTKEQLRLMWQTLLAERFHLKTHVTTKDFPVFELSISKNGPNLQKTGEDPQRLQPGFPILAAGSHRGFLMAPPRNVRQTFHDYSMTELAQLLAWTVATEGASGYVGYFSPGKVIDKTGLDDHYDFTLEFAGRLQSGAFPAPLPDGEADTAPYLFDALQQQLGLKLEEKKDRLEVLVVDSVDRVPGDEQ